MKPGIYSGISNADYHGGPGISKSGLDLVHRSPMHYHYAATAENDNEPTPAMMIGTAFHCLILEPEVFAQEYTLALRQSDVPDAIADKDVLIAMVARLNESRLPKLPTSGSKDELIARLMTVLPMNDPTPDAEYLARYQGMKAGELKTALDAVNLSRAGLLSTTGTMETLAQTLRDNGVPVTLWAEAKAEWMANNGHRIALNQDQWDQLHGMRNAVINDPVAGPLMAAPGRAEQSVYWVDNKTGVLCRCRPDFWRDDGIIVDVKTTDDASDDGFAQSIRKWRYHVQAPFYVDGVTAAINYMKSFVNSPDYDPLLSGEVFIPPLPRAFVFLAVEKKAPYAVSVYVLKPDSMDMGRAEYRADLDLYAACHLAGKWPGYGGKIREIGLSDWYMRENAHLLDAA